MNEREKKIKSLIKKRDQIKVLIERQTKGEKLERNQVFIEMNRKYRKSFFKEIKFCLLKDRENCITR